MKPCPYFTYREGCRCRHCRGVCKCDKRRHRPDVTNYDARYPAGRLHL